MDTLDFVMDLQLEKCEAREQQMQHEQQMVNDENYALDCLGLYEIHDKLEILSKDLEAYDHHLTVGELINKLKEI